MVTHTPYHVLFKNSEVHISEEFFIFSFYIQNVKCIVSMQICYKPSAGSSICSGCSGGSSGSGSSSRSIGTSGSGCSSGGGSSGSGSSCSSSSIGSGGGGSNGIGTSSSCSTTSISSSSSTCYVCMYMHVPWEPCNFYSTIPGIVHRIGAFAQSALCCGM